MKSIVEKSRDLDGCIVGTASGKLYRVHEPPFWRVDRWLVWWWAGGGRVVRAIAWLLRVRGAAYERCVVDFTVAGKRLKARALPTTR